MGVPLFGPADLEGHLGKDGRFYLIDFARLFPPTKLDLKNHPRGFLYQLFRPEFVAQYSKTQGERYPLSSDALSRFAMLDPKRDQWNADVIEASDHLLTNVLPSLVGSLVNKFDELVEDPAKISTEMHRVGVNVRFLGLLRSRCGGYNSLQDLLLREMIARTAKNIMRADLREVMQRGSHAKTPKEVVANILTAVVSHDSKFWKKRLIPKLETSFLCFLSDAEKKETKDMLGEDHIHSHLLRFIDRFQRLANVSLSTQAMDLVKKEQNKVFLASDISELIPRVKHIPIIEEAEANKSLLEAATEETFDIQKNGPKIQRLLKNACHFYEQAIQGFTDNPQLLIAYGEALIESAHGETQMLIACNKLKDATEVSPFEKVSLLWQAANICYKHRWNGKRYVKYQWKVPESTCLNSVKNFYEHFFNLLLQSSSSTSTSSGSGSLEKPQQQPSVSSHSLNDEFLRDVDRLIDKVERRALKLFKEAQNLTDNDISTYPPYQHQVEKAGLDAKTRLRPPIILDAATEVAIFSEGKKESKREVRSRVEQKPRPQQEAKKSSLLNIFGISRQTKPKGKKKGEMEMDYDDDDFPRRSRSKPKSEATEEDLARADREAQEAMKAQLLFHFRTLLGQCSLDLQAICAGARKAQGKSPSELLASLKQDYATAETQWKLPLPVGSIPPPMTEMVISKPSIPEDDFMGKELTKRGFSSKFFDVDY
jgi:hypothetical protein